MAGKIRYQIANSTQILCSILKISPERTLRRAGLPADYLCHEQQGVNSRQYFDLWDAAEAEAKRPDHSIFLAKTLARGPFASAVFALSCSPNIEIGLSRLALFKPLLSPVRLTIERSSYSLSLSFNSADQDIPIPDSFTIFEMVYFTELARIFTTEPIVPMAVNIPELLHYQDALSEYFGVVPKVATKNALILSLEDAHRPLISENEQLWASFAPDLHRQLRKTDPDGPMGARVKNALLELLPGGQSSAQAVCERLHISKRSLQRQLKNEGGTFQHILDTTREELSVHCLSKSDLSVEEISYLLAYRDPNSFYRAFQGWTGMTPKNAREMHSEPAN
ncbi:MAG: AraC family transcriptional regulator [Hyphomicrobiales bacterium]|nr:AraC family transcriptional regulator [Hyphomicrobiales bacterium]